MRDCLVCGETGHESCDYFGPMFVRCSGCGFVTRDGYTMEVGVPLECDECGIEDGARWDRADGSAVCDGCIGG